MNNEENSDAANEFDRNNATNLPKWQQSLQARGILESAQEAGWHPVSWKGTPGMAYFLCDEHGQPVYQTDGKPARRWRNLNRESQDFRFAWGYPTTKKGEAKPDGCDFYHHPGIDLAAEVHKADGTLIIACGESDMETFITVGYHNVTSFLGEKNIPHNLVEKSRSWGVKRIIYPTDNDTTGREAAGKIAHTLRGTGIELSLLELPVNIDETPIKDINDLFVALSCDQERFRTTLDQLTSLTIPGIEQHDASATSDASTGEGVRSVPANRPFRELPEAFYSALEEALGIKSYQPDGWSKPVACPFKHHEHDNIRPAAQYHREMHILHCFKCGQTWLAIETGEALGLDWQDYIEHPQRKNGRQKSRSANGAPDSQPKPQPPTDDEIGDVIIAEADGNLAYFHGIFNRYSDGRWQYEPGVDLEIWETTKTFKPKVRPTETRTHSIRRYLVNKLAVNDDRTNAGTDYINLQNGLFNLETGLIEDHRRDLYPTTQLPFAFQPSARCPIWIHCLHEWFATPDGKVDHALIALLQEAMGYSLTADISREAAFWLYGPAASGKSTIIRVLQALMGEVYVTLDFNTLDKNHYQLADVAGKRVVTCTEARSGAVLADHIVKQLISGEELVARYPYGKPFRLKPQAKLWWAMNTLPTNPDRSDGVFRRLNIIPCNNPIPPERRDRGLFHRLEAELPGIFNWALEGLKRLRQNGKFTEAAQAQQTVEDYRRDNDIERSFVEERCITGPNLSVQGGVLYDEYKWWCERNGHKPKASNKASEDWRRLGFTKPKNGTVTYYGVALKGNTTRKS